VRTLDIDECAEFLKVDRSTALRLAGGGELPGAKIGRAWVFLLDDLVEYLRTQVRSQARQRQAEADTDGALNKAVVNNASFVMSPMRRRPKNAAPDLSGYPDLTRASPPNLSRAG